MSREQCFVQNIFLQTCLVKVRLLYLVARGVVTKVTARAREAAGWPDFSIRHDWHRAWVPQYFQWPMKMF